MKSLSNALDRLEEALALSLDDDVHRDAAILRFVLVYELFWKTLKRCLAYEKMETNYPKETLKKAYQVYWLKDEEVWLDMVDDGNLAAHTYDEEKAKEIYERIRGYLPELRRTYAFLQSKFADILATEETSL
jgi:nucleotidyltransferase substrate binding protein (TIGR01987 family)